MRAEVLKGHLDGLMLAALEDGPLHGYAVMEALRTNSNGTFNLPTGTIYPALHRLERRGLVAASWSSNEGRRRRTYSLTSAGRKELAAQRANWQEFSTAMSAVLNGETSWPAPA